MFYSIKSNSVYFIVFAFLFGLSTKSHGQCIEDDFNTLDNWITIGIDSFNNGSAVLSTGDGVGPEEVVNIELMLGIEAGSLNALVNSMSETVGGDNNFTEGSAIKREITVCEGTEVCFEYQLFTEESPNFIDAYTDLAFVALVQDGVMSIIDLLDPSLVSSTTLDYNLESPKMTFCHSFTSPATGYLAIGILDEDDTSLKSDIFISDLSIDNCCPIENIELSDSCFCLNQNNVLLEDSTFLFSDTLIVTSFAGPVTLSNTDMKLLDALGNSIAANTPFILDNNTGEYKLEIYTAVGDSTTVEISNGLSTANFTAGGCSSCEIGAVESMNNLEVSDPCFCGNPKNIELADGTFLFNDTLIVISSIGPVTLLTTDMNLLDASGDPIDAGTSFILDSNTGEYKLEIFTESGASSNIEISNVFGTVGFTAGGCSACEVVPTMGEWGLICLGLLLLIFGVSSIKQMSYQLKLN